MKKLLLVCTIFALTGCSTPVPVAMKFPEVPAELLKTCPDLKTLDLETKKLSDVINVVVDNYGQYYNCKSNIDDWIEWYNTQKKIYESVK
jgi:hypothetical protein